MIFRDSPRFIFVHIPKTGGTSVEATLSKRLVGKNLPDLTIEEARRYALPKQGTSLQHLKLHQYERRFRVNASDFFSFAFVRNPWDLVVSEIRYFRKYERKTFDCPTFPENVRKLVNFKGSLWGHNFSPQHTYLTDSLGNLAIGFLGRFETLQKDFDVISDRLGLERATLPCIFNTSHGLPLYPEMYDDESRELVARRFARDIELFNYSF